MKTIFLPIFIIVAYLLTKIIKTAQKVARTAPSEVKTLEWAKKAVIYEVNIRQYSKVGTFNAFAKDIPRLVGLGVNILWLMPIYPIGVKNRKQGLGSYYSISDFKAINPEFGTMEDFKRLVKLTHEAGMKIIIDWVANHSAWDHAFVKKHPEFYKRDVLGRFVSPFDWSDIISFDFENEQMRLWMIENMKWWLNETDIDGFRCDVANMIPIDFWNSCRKALEEVKPVFLLAESDQPELHKHAFDMTYDWRMHHIMNDIAKRKKNANDIEKHFKYVNENYPLGSILMQFTSNHDENSWNGTEFERLGEGVKTFAVLAATVPGMMLIYNGQEAAFNRRLKFFEKDEILWKDYSFSYFYKTLTFLKKSHSSLWNGSEAGSFERLFSTSPRSIYAFKREKGNDKVVVVTNLSNKEHNILLKTELKGSYHEIFSERKVEFRNYMKMKLKPWGYWIFVQEK